MDAGAGPPTAPADRTSRTARLDSLEAGKIVARGVAWRIVNRSRWAVGSRGGERGVVWGGAPGRWAGGGRAGRGRLGGASHG